MSNTIEDNFRFDTRIRERMLDRGRITEEETKARIEALADLEGEAEALDLEQPAITAAAQPAEGEAG